MQGSKDNLSSLRKESAKEAERIEKLLINLNTNLKLLQKEEEFLVQQKRTHEAKLNTEFTGTIRSPFDINSSTKHPE